MKLLPIMLCLLLFSCSQDSQQKPLTNESNTVTFDTPPQIIVAMGDSLTEGYRVDEAQAYPARLEHKLQQNNHNYTVINAGISGETTSSALSRVNWILTLKPDIVILESGPNDAFRGVDLALTQRNLDAIITKFKAQNIKVILAGLQISQNLGVDYVRQFAAMYPTLATKHNLTLIPFFLENVATIRELNQADGIHPTAEGYEIVVENIYPYVIEEITSKH